MSSAKQLDKEQECEDLDSKEKELENQDSKEELENQVETDLPSSYCDGSLSDLNERSLTDDSFYERVDRKRYERLEVLGQGRYATVYRAQDLHEKTIVAIKHLRMLNEKEQNYLGKTSLHEVDILSTLSHRNIIHLKESFCEGIQNILIMECMDFSLENLIMDRAIKEFLLPQIKYYIVNIAEGLAYLHDQKVIHRDLKPNNILLSRNGDLKIADFGLSRRIMGDSHYTKVQFACRYYRAPEVLLGATVYRQNVDTWAFGCIIAEFYLRKPLFAGACDILQWNLISGILGSPVRHSETNDNDFSGLEVCFEQKSPRSVSSTLPRGHPLMISVIDGCLLYDTEKRWSSKECLDYLMGCEKECPCCHPNELPIPSSLQRRHVNSCTTEARKRLSMDSRSNLELSLNCSGFTGDGDSPRKYSLNVQEKLSHSKARRRLQFSPKEDEESDEETRPRQLLGPILQAH